MSNSWQDLFSTWKSRMAFLHGKKHMTDCKFILEEDRNKIEINLHKMVLGSCSTEFFNLWFMCEAIGQDEIIIRDVSKEALNAFVYYLYNEKVELNLDIVWDLLKLAKLYGVKSLINFCASFLEKIVDRYNFLLILNKISNYGLDNVEIQCFYYWGRVTDFSHAFSTFYSIIPEVLKKLLEFGDFNGTELGIYKEINKWSEKQCEIKHFEKSYENKRLVLGNCANFVKFSKMTIEEFKSIDNDDLFLTSNERLNVYRNILTKHSRRDYIQLDAMSINDKVKKIENVENSSIYFSSSRYIRYLYGFYIFGKTRKCTENITFFLKDKLYNNFLIQDEVQVEFNGTPRKYKIFFKTPIALDWNKDLQYHLGIKKLGSCERFCGTDYSDCLTYSGAKIIRGILYNSIEE